MSTTSFTNLRDAKLFHVQVVESFVDFYFYLAQILVVNPDK